MKDLRFSYKTMWYNPKSKTKELTNYSSTFKTEKEALTWYNNFGIKLENMFKRKLILTDREL